MTSVLTRRLRWLVPAGIAAAIAAASLTAAAAADASAQPKLDPQTAAQLLVAVEHANPAGFSGTIVESTHLGLPQLPNVGGATDGSGLDVQTLITGSHTANVWYAGIDRQRVALLGQLSESDVIHNGSDMWTYSSSTRAVTHRVLPADAGANAKHAAEDATSQLTPQAAAEKALAAIDPTTTVQVDDTARVAGHAAYQLLLIPKDARSLVGSVRIAIDAKTSVPLRVQVFARDAANPAFEVGFTDVSFNVPNLSVFTFVPPAGSTVNAPANGPTDIKRRVPDGGTIDPNALKGVGPTDATPSTPTKILGSGWTAVVESSSSIGGPGGPPLFDQLGTPVSGGQLITTPLISVLVTNDGKMFAGAVTPAALQQVASTGRGL